MAKILVTGGAGFLGYHLARHLIARGDEVDLLDNFARAVRDPDLEDLLREPAIRLIDRDLLAHDAVADLDRDYEVVFHFAAIVGVTHVLKRPYDVLALNTRLLTNVIDLCHTQRELRRLVFASTSEVYAGTLRTFGLPIPTPEKTPLTVAALEEPRTSYMLSKIYGEALCHHSRLPFTIVRPHNIYGPRMGMVHVVPELLKRAYDTPNGGRMQVYSMNHKRTFCFVTDAVDLLLRVADSLRCQGVTLNVGSNDREVTIGELAHLVLEVVGRHLQLEAMPETPGSPARRAPDMALARELTAFASRTDLREGLTRTYEWYRANVFEGSGVTSQ